MNYAHFAGRLGRDADLKHTPNGQTVANFALAVDAGWGDNKQTLWIDCAVWGERAEKLAPYLTKGKPVTVSGDVGLRQFEKRDGTAGASLTLNVVRVTLQGNGTAASDATPAAAAPAPAPKPAPKPAPTQAAADFDDDIPF